jgi:hypothetical protein
VEIGEIVGAVIFFNVLRVGGGEGEVAAGLNRLFALLPKS